MCCDDIVFRSFSIWFPGTVYPVLMTNHFSLPIWLCCLCSVLFIKNYFLFQNHSLLWFLRPVFDWFCIDTGSSVGSIEDDVEGVCCLCSPTGAVIDRLHVKVWTILVDHCCMRSHCRKRITWSIHIVECIFCLSLFVMINLSKSVCLRRISIPSLMIQSQCMAFW